MERNTSLADAMVLTRAPRPALRPFVHVLWATDEAQRPGPFLAHREHVLPTGQAHITLRLSDDPLRLFDAVDDTAGRIVSEAVVGGARASFYIREVSRPLCSVGAQLLPGATEALFGVPADELAGRHTSLDDLWGGLPVASMRDRLAQRRSLEGRLDLFEEMLAARLPRARALHPAIAQALDELRANANVRDVVRRSGYSHRALISLFTRSVGLTPKVYSRVQRFQGTLRHASGPARAAWVEIAMMAGYSDQSHFAREFRELTSVTPTLYRRVSPTFAHHLPVGGAALIDQGQISSRR